MDRMRMTSALLAAGLLAAPPAWCGDEPANPWRLVRSRGCLVCHEVESRGPHAAVPNAPAFQDVARRYRGDSAAAERLASVVREGSPPLRRDRHWNGKVAFDQMYPNDLLVTEEEGRRIVEWILALDVPAGTTARGSSARR